jgi:hypothetical protein
MFAETWVDRWVLPNPFISPVLSVLRPSGVELSDLSLNKDATNLGETYLNVTIRRHNAAARVGLDAVTFIVANPDWEMAPELVPLFDQIAAAICEIVRAKPVSQKATLALHITAGPIDFKVKTARLVNGDLPGDALFCGVSLHRADGALIIDKSLKYPNAAFVRIERTHRGDAVFSDVATTLYDDEIAALGLLGIEGIS